MGNGHRDTLTGTAADDTFLFRRGDGADVLVSRGGANGGDAVVFGAGVRTDQVWFSRQLEDLEIGLVGSADRLALRDWYANPAARVSEFRTTDGSVLVESRVELLRQAMAAFSPPSGTDLDLPDAVEQTLEPVIAATWEKPPAST